MTNEAEARINQYIHKTPVYSHDILIKAENLQYTGSFKLRGAASKLTLLKEEGITDVITASTGNHGMATAYMLTKLQMNGRVYVPTSISPKKKKALEKHNIELVEYGSDSSQSEWKAREVSEDSGIPYISPYNDRHIIAGQGTIALELLEILDTVKRIYVTIGGGGLISGLGSVVKSHFPEIQIIGCQPKNSPVMYESIQAGKIIDYESTHTLSDGSAGGIDKGSITFPLVSEVVDRFVLIEENDIKNGIKHAFDKYNQIIEGAAGVALASALKDIRTTPAINSDELLVVFCGGNIDHKIWKNLIV